MYSSLFKNDEMEQWPENIITTLLSIGDAVISTDKNGLIVIMNPIAEELTGWNFKDAKKRPIEEIFRIIDEKTGTPLETPVSKVLKDGSKVELKRDTILISKDGKKIPVSDNCAPILDWNKNITGVVLIFRDITRIKEMEEKLLQSQKMEAIGHLAGGIAHDFNNILTGMLGYANLIKIEAQPDSVIYDAAATIEKAGARATELIKQLLSFSRKSKSINIPLDIHNIILEMLLLIKRTFGKNIKIYNRLNAINPVITGDPAQIQQVILNLAVNARDAMPAGGDLIIETEQVKSDNNDTSCEYIVISIKDNGCGIDEKTQKHIFEPFFTTKEKGKGTGMGLAITYTIVKNHGGFIKVISEVNKGSNFKIYLPLNSKAESANELEYKKKPEKIYSGKGKILILDDEKVILEVTSRVLRSLGYEVITVCNATEGLEYFRKNSNEIDIVILDIIMPNVNGLECFHEFKKINPDSNIILSSGYGIDENIQELVRQGLCQFIQKPYNISELSKIIESIR